MLKKFFLIGLEALFCASLYGDIPDPMVKELSKSEFKALPKEQRQAYMQRLVEVKTGGFVLKAGTGKGRIIVSNCSKRIDLGSISDLYKESWRTLKIRVDFQNCELKSIDEVFHGRKSNIAEAVVYVVEEEHLPRLLVAPEEGYGIVNVSACAHKDSSIFQNRVRKEILRAIAFVAGAGNSGNVMQSVTNESALDKINVITLPMQARNQMILHLENLGITPVIETTYLKACQEGWAPAPTNDVQKAISERVRTAKERGPTNPLQIKP